MTYLLVMCKVLGQSPLQPDQYRSSIKSPVLLYSLSIQTHKKTILTITQPSNSQDFDVNQQFNWKLHFVNRYCFCNTELKTAIVTKIKDSRFRHNRTHLYYLHYLRFTLDERKTLTKISTRKTSHNRSPNQRTLQMTKKQGENPPLKTNNKLYRKEPFASYVPDQTAIIRNMRYLNVTKTVADPGFSKRVGGGM